MQVDHYPYNEEESITEWVTRVIDEYPHLNILGEVFMHETAHIAFWQKDSKIGAIQGFNSNLPSVMDFPLHDIFPQVFNQSEQNWGDGLFKVYDHLTLDFLYPNINNLLIMMGNHDVNRINQAFDGDVEKYKLAITLLATLRGIPQIYYGDEIGMQGEKSKGDGDIRRDFPGGWPGDPQNAFLQSGRTEEQKAYFDYTKKLLNWRKTKSVIHKGKTLHFSPVDNVYVYFRYFPDDSKDVVMVILNNSLKDQQIDLTRFAEGIQNHQSGTDAITGQDIVFDKLLKINAKSSLVLDLN